jgi:hypothetical protein
VPLHGFATLGVPEAAFKKLETLDYWKVALLRHESLKELEELAPQVTQPILEKLRHVPAPFCWFTDHDPELVLRAFYLSVILAQHAENWNLLLANLDGTPLLPYCTCGWAYHAADRRASLCSACPPKSEAPEP